MRTYTIVLADSTKVEVEADDVDLAYIANGESGFVVGTSWFNLTNDDDMTVAAFPYKEVKYITSSK